MSGLRVLISGAGIAGPTLAFWLARAGARVTVVERAPAQRKAGQNIDIRGAGLEVVRRMQLEDAIRSKTTQEQGIAFVDGKNRKRAEFPVDPSGKGVTFTSEVEILRGDLTQILYDATREEVEYLFGDYVTSITEQDDIVSVGFAKGTQKRDFDIVVAADGLGSSTRALAFGDGEKNAVRSLGQYTSYFTIPYAESDGTWARWYNAPRGRSIFLRPDGTVDTTRAFLSIMSTSDRLAEATRLDTKTQKSLMRELFDDAGWEAPRVLAGMDGSPDFYMQTNAQVEMDRWCCGRTALLGDAGYCPSPISGMGTTLAIVGAYVLAGEIARHPRDHEAAFAAYDRLMRPFVDKAQSLPPGAPALANPQTEWGIAILNNVLAFVSWTGLASLLGRFGGPPADTIQLPEYGM